LNGEDEEEMKQDVQVDQMDDRSTKTSDLSSELIEKSKKMLDASEKQQLLKRNQTAIKRHIPDIGQEQMYHTLINTGLGRLILAPLPDYLVDFLNTWTMPVF